MNKLKLMALLPTVIALITVVSCKKEAATSETPLQTTAVNLTSCPVGSTCNYLFTEAADLNSTNTGLVGGSYRVFWFQKQESHFSLTSTIYMKVPMAGNSFELKKADVLNGKVVFFQNCPSCNLVPMTVTDGHITGTNATPGKRGDQTKWLLDGQVVLQTQGGSLKDTITFRQLFSPSFVYN